MNVSEIIDAFGGTAVTAGLFGVVPSAVSNWRAADHFPDRLHFRISREAERQGIKFDDSVFAPRQTAQNIPLKAVQSGRAGE